MRRYQFLTQDSVYQALNKLRAAFLAAQNGNQVESIIKGVLTHDERMKVGRRIEIAQMVEDGLTYQQICQELKVGLTTVVSVVKKMEQDPECFKLINRREDLVNQAYKRQAFQSEGGPKKVFKSIKYTGFKRKDVPR